jgi:3-(3-hydroxy-phenyl)propionate hydroxylase
MSEAAEQAVAIVGGGPTGMMLGAELALAGVEALILERRPNQELDGSRAGGLHSRAIELLDQRGVAGRFLSAGKPAQVITFGGAPIDISDLPTRRPYTLALFQRHIERIMAEWIWDLGVTMRYGQQVVGFSQDADGVTVDLADGTTIRTQYLVGCDGGRSRVRKGTGIDFPGAKATESTIIAEAEMVEAQIGIHRGPVGTGGIGPIDGGPKLRIVVPEVRLESGAEPTLDELRDALFVVYGTDFKVHSPTWISRFTDATRQASSYRNGRVLIAGDAAHIHSPMGGQGIQMGLEDAVNLGWKLAQVVKGESPESLLDTYQSERHPAAARALAYTMSLNTLSRQDPRTESLRDLAGEIASMPEPRHHLGALASGLSVRYDLGDTHPLLGRRVPDLDITTSEGPTTIFTLLHEARPILLNLGKPATINPADLPARTRLIDARSDSPWTLPALGEVTAPTALLIRPDGHVAWVDDYDDASPVESLATHPARLPQLRDTIYVPFCR